MAVGGNSPQPEPKYPPYGDQPKTSSGSPTYPLDMVAALTEDRRYLTVAIVNATESKQDFDLKVLGVRRTGPPTLWRMTASSATATNQLGQPAQVEVNEAPAGETAGRTIDVAPISINIYRFPVAAGGEQQR